ncbi:hypothetical protein C8F04DRAFT_1192350 [Mycena alexandri]|uniref:F-box domain-containing protein n=1 Tax=Mycena alexandri TaxID=1745969 RepID=A0AAD6SB78_9AGAR|nr:hypothetical protein C8F04DRAFT_1192350 [Mycena alexandri]
MPSTIKKTLTSFPKKVLRRILRHLGEDDLSALAATCRIAVRIVRHTVLMSAVRFRKINEMVSPPGSGCIAGPTRVALNNLSIELISVIIGNLGPMRMISFSRTCRKYRAAYLTHIHSETKKEISRFDIDPEDLMRALLKTGGIVVGSIPIRVLTGGNFKPSDLDIIVPASAEDTIKVLIATKFGYSSTGSEVLKGVNPSLRVEHTFRKKSLVIKIRVAKGENAVVPVMLSHSTIAMNYISPWGIFSAYPQLTLANRALFNHYTDDEFGDSLGINYRRVVEIFDKYSNRGIQFAMDASPWYNTSAHKCYSSSLCTHTIRTLYDKGSIFIRFPGREHQRKYLSNVIRYNERHTVVWSLGGNYCNQADIFHRAFSISQRVFPEYANLY